MEQVLESLKNGSIAIVVNKVSKNKMKRNVSIYYKDKDTYRIIPAEVSSKLKRVKPLNDREIEVSGVGMDMLCFTYLELCNACGYEKGRVEQKYLSFVSNDNFMRYLETTNSLKISHQNHTIEQTESNKTNDIAKKPKQAMKKQVKSLNNGGLGR